MTTPALTAIRLGDLMLPPHDYKAFTYVGSGTANDDNVATITGYRGGSAGTAVGVLTFTYVGVTNNVASIAMTFAAVGGG